MTTLATAVQDATIRLGQDLAGRGWDLGAALWSIHPHEDGSVTLEKHGGDAFLAVPVEALVEALVPPHDEHAGYVITFEAWLSDTGVTELAEDALDRVDVRYIVAAVTTGTCVVFEHRRDRAKARVTFDDGKTPPIGVAAMCAHMRSKVCAPRPTSPQPTGMAIPPDVSKFFQMLGVTPTSAILFDLRGEPDERPLA